MKMAHGMIRMTRIRSAARAVLAGLLLASFAAPPAWAADGDKPAQRTPAAPADRPGMNEKVRERMQWEARITFFGEEETANWSLRILDVSAPPESAKVKLVELWKVDIGTKKWVKIDEGAPAVTIFPLKQKPATAPPDSQLIADLPLKQNDVGLYYAKWRVNDDINGATLTRIGPGLVGDAAKAAKDNPPKVPRGMMAAVVPVDVHKAELMVIPDPQVGTGQSVKEPPPGKPGDKGGK